jgi:hypothetical protein
VLFWCPGCSEGHQVYIGTWTWNGSLDLPTFTPSVLIRGNQWPKDEYPEYHKAAHGSVPAGGETVCHTFVTDGRIQFLGDCTHALAGQTVDLPEWPPVRHDRGCAASVASSARCTCVFPPGAPAPSKRGEQQ